MASRVKPITRIVASVLIFGTLAFLWGQASYKQRLPNEIKGIVVPHHLLVEKYIDDLYKLTAEKDPTINRIILLSPNHFGYGFSYLQSTNQAFTPENSPKLDKNLLIALSKKTSLKIDTAYFEKEHGVMNELPYINKYFPYAKVVPIRIKPSTPISQLEALIKEISTMDLSHTLVIASIDFTHYESEETALKNDNQILDWLKNWATKNPKADFQEIKKLAVSISKTVQDSVAMDSPESFYILLKLMEKESANTFSLIKRTSSASLLNIKDPLQNTSHIFGTFSIDINQSKE
jgi:AmmeMemoRadiSam system protein B